ncbi:class I SAM-dependent methyltransferase [Vulcanisaeta thermophila]|uniref:class I SAM-dependent methyltransferase n=1 Tax=Vulcanisaeta thermophila TaxID=867917 RepID=UPI001EE39843|nr:class I SAM-dependent methyltransferase [Vulcanisaeta thermophila]
MERVNAFRNIMSRIFAGSDYETVNTALTLFMLRKLRYWASNEIIRSLVKRSGLMLDLGAGNGAMTKYLLTLINNSGNNVAHLIRGIVLVDPSLQGLMEAKSLGYIVDPVVGIAEALPIRSSAISIAYSAFALRQFRDKVRALLEVRRVLARGGYFILLEFWRPTWVFMYVVLLFYLVLPLRIIVALLSPRHIGDYGVMRDTVLDIGDVGWLRDLARVLVGDVVYLRTYLSIFVLMRVTRS